MGEHNCYGTDLQECIKGKAYELWEKDGHKNGNDLYYWLEAESTVKPHHNHKERNNYAKSMDQ